MESLFYVSPQRFSRQLIKVRPYINVNKCKIIRHLEMLMGEFLFSSRLSMRSLAIAFDREKSFRYILLYISQRSKENYEALGILIA